MRNCYSWMSLSIWIIHSEDWWTVEIICFHLKRILHEFEGSFFYFLCQSFGNIFSMIQWCIVSRLRITHSYSMIIGQSSESSSRGFPLILIQIEFILELVFSNSWNIEISIGTGNWMEYSSFFLSYIFTIAHEECGVPKRFTESCVSNSKELSCMFVECNILFHFPITEMYIWFSQLFVCVLDSLRLFLHRNWGIFLDFYNKESSCFIDVWPEFLLKSDFEYSWIFSHHRLYDSFIFHEIERTCWVYHFSTNF